MLFRFSKRYLVGPDELCDLNGLRNRLNRYGTVGSNAERGLHKPNLSYEQFMLQRVGKGCQLNFFSMDYRFVIFGDFNAN